MLWYVFLLIFVHRFNNATVTLKQLSLEGGYHQNYVDSRKQNNNNNKSSTNFVNASQISPLSSQNSSFKNYLRDKSYSK